MAPSPPIPIQILTHFWHPRTAYCQCMCHAGIKPTHTIQIFLDLMHFCAGKWFELIGMDCAANDADDPGSVLNTSQRVLMRLTLSWSCTLNASQELQCCFPFSFVQNWSSLGTQGYAVIGITVQSVRLGNSLQKHRWAKLKHHSSMHRYGQKFQGGKSWSKGDRWQKMLMAPETPKFHSGWSWEGREEQLQARNVTESKWKDSEISKR